MKKTRPRRRLRHREAPAPRRRASLPARTRGLPLLYPVFLLFLPVSFVLKRGREIAFAFFFFVARAGGGVRKQRGNVSSFSRFPVLFLSPFVERRFASPPSKVYQALSLADTYVSCAVSCAFSLPLRGRPLPLPRSRPPPGGSGCGSCRRPRPRREPSRPG